MESFYRIMGWSRRNDIGLGSCIFSILLDAHFAEKTRNLNFAENQRKFEECIRKIVGYEYARATFLGDSAFLSSMSVEGDCACLGVDGSILDSDWNGMSFIEYHGHNIDNKNQAYDLLTIFSCWVDFVEALIE